MKFIKNKASMQTWPPKDRTFIQNELLAWFKKHKRPLPWRQTYDPYQVWISEIMLQQTQVKTMLPYFDRWMKALPRIQSVAEASEETLLKQWEGLGYYSRVRNIQKAAKIIVEQHGGTFPEKHEIIRQLPGIGPYTAGAISSIAFNEDRPLLDGNVIRVLARLLNSSDNTQTPKVRAKLWKHSESLIPRGKARDFNQAMMEFGALVCTPKNPMCSFCPLKPICRAEQAGTVNDLPRKGAKREKVHLKVAIAIIEKSNKIFIQKRPHGGLMGGLWEFPGGKAKKGEDVQRALEREISEEMGIQVEKVQPFMRLKHAYTHHLVDLHCFKAKYKKGKIQLNSATDFKWVSLHELEQFAFPAANVKLIKKLTFLSKINLLK